MISANQLDARRDVACRPRVLCRILCGTALVTLHAVPMAMAQEVPAGGAYVAGQGSIATSGSGVRVEQTSANGIINWSSFSIAAGKSVQIDNGAGATLNRVTGTDISRIDGLLSATGSVYLINPQGIVIGSGGQVLTNGSFVASTRDLSDDAFMRGDASQFTGSSGGTVVNQGSIASLQGDVVLIGQAVTNSGRIDAPGGVAALAAGDSVTLRPLGGDRRIAIGFGSGDVTNSGTIAAAQAELAAAHGNVYALAGNNGGLISATGTVTIDGHVWLTAGETTEVAGTVSAVNADGSGGTIVATAADVALEAGAQLSVSGTKGGLLLVGGDEAGGHDAARRRLPGSDIATASTLEVAEGAQLSADGASGQGGAVVLWSEDHTAYQGTISARGAGGADGGFAEVSSHGQLDYLGNTDLLSDSGGTGTLLLDPNNLTISTGTTSNAGTAPTYVAGSTNSVLRASDLAAALGSANVSATASGKITVSTAVSWTAATTLTLTAGDELAVNASISNTNAASGLNLGSSTDVYLQSGTLSPRTIVITAPTIATASGIINNTTMAGSSATLTATSTDTTLWGISAGAITTNTLKLSSNIQNSTGVLTATNLLLQGAGPYDLTSGNVIGTLAASATARINLVNAGSLAIGTVGGVSGVTTTNQFNLQITGNSRAITQSQAIIAPNFSLRSTGTGVTYTLTNAVNNIGAFGAAVGTAVLKLYDTGGFDIGTVPYDANNYLTGVTAGSLTLSDNGAVTQSQKIALSTNSGLGQLELLGTGSYTLTNSANVIGTLAANTGSLSVARTSTAALVVGTAGSTNGITTTGAATLSTPGAITVNKAIGSGGDVTLGAGTTIAVNASLTATGGSSIWLRPDTAGNGASSRAVTFGSGIKATTSGAGVAAIYYNPATFGVADRDYSGNATGNLRQYMYVRTLSQFAQIGNDLSGSYALNADLDASSLSGFVPIGNANTAFTGNFDGLGHIISGLVINRSGADDVGLFGVVQGASISNVTLAGGSITGGNRVGALIGSMDATSQASGDFSSAAVAGIDRVGGLVGAMDGGTITRSAATGAITASGPGSMAGGLVGYQGGTVSQSYASGNVTAAGEAGGLSGHLAAGGSITQAYATGGATAAIAGGLIGGMEGDVSQSYATGAVAGTSQAGGVAGSQTSGTASAVYWDSDTTGQGAASGNGAIAGASALTSAQFTTAANFAGWSFGTTPGGSGWAILDSDYTLNNAGGAAGATRPIMLWEASTNNVIVNGHQLQLMALNLSGSYKLGGNIDLSETASASGIWLGSGFLPIGTAVASTTPINLGDTLTVISGTPFTGSLDGQNHSIVNLTIDRPTSDYVGLFGYTFSTLSQQTIKNLTLTGGSVTGQDHVGALIGGNTSYGSDGLQVIVTLTNLASSTAVNGRDFTGGLTGSLEYGYLTTLKSSGAVSGRDYTGGLMGWFNGSAAYVDTLQTMGAVSGRDYVGGIAGFYYSGLYNTNYALGNVTATGNDVGGAFGYLIGGESSPTTLFATGNVSGAGNVGGLIGLSDGGTLDQTYASGNVMATGGYAGGLVGQVINYGTIGRSYATGAVGSPGSGAENYAGGLVGLMSSGTIAQSYASGTVTGTAGHVGGIAGQVNQDVGTTTIDGTVYWDTYSTGQASGYGTLAAGTFSANTVTSNPTQASAANYAYKASAYGNFTASNWVFFTGQTRPFGAWEVPASGAAIVTSHQLQLINTKAATETGSFTLGRSIDLAETGANLGTAATSGGMWTSAGFVPLGTDGLGNVWDGTSYKLLANITSGTFGFTGSLNGGGYTLSNLGVNRATIKNVGLFGVSSGTLSNLTVGGTVKGSNGTGGLVGQLHGGSISGAISTANVTGGNLVGGLVGNQAAGTTITLSSASGMATGTDDVGGLVGYDSGGSISRSFASGAASGSHYVGGLVGYQYQGSVTNSYAIGAAAAAINTAGGLIGKADGTSISSSYSTGAVTAPATAGGMLGQSVNGTTATNSYWDTGTSGQATSAGGTGRTSAQMKTQGNFTGWDFTTIWTVGSDGRPALRPGS